MTKDTLQNILLLLVVALILAVVSDARADMYDDYAEEFVPYIIIDNNRILPEYTKFKCENNILYKNKQRVMMYTGKAKSCNIVYIKRKEYGKDHDITTLF